MEGNLYGCATDLIPARRYQARLANRMLQMQQNHHPIRGAIAPAARAFLGFFIEK